MVVGDAPAHVAPAVVPTSNWAPMSVVYFSATCEEADLSSDRAALALVRSLSS
jgi:hypothetical protein